MVPTKILAAGMAEAMKAKADSLVGMELAYQFIITGDDPMSFFLILSGGTVTFGEGESSAAEVVITMNSIHFADLLTGKLNGNKAIATRKLKIQGDMTKVMLLAKFIA